MYPVSLDLDTGAEKNLVWEDLLAVEWLGSIQINSWLLCKIQINFKVNAVWTITMKLQMADSRLRVVSSVVRNLTVQVILQNSFFDKFVTGLRKTKRSRTWSIDCMVLSRKKVSLILLLSTFESSYCTFGQMSISIVSVFFFILRGLRWISPMALAAFCTFLVQW